MCVYFQERQKQLESLGISLQSSGIKVGEDKCFLVNLNADPALNELLVYYLKVGPCTKRVLCISVLRKSHRHPIFFYINIVLNNCFGFLYLCGSLVFVFSFHYFIIYALLILIIINSCAYFCTILWYMHTLINGFSCGVWPWSTVCGSRSQEHTKVGSADSQDIQLCGMGIQAEHCIIDISGDAGVILTPHRNSRYAHGHQRHHQASPAATRTRHQDTCHRLLIFFSCVFLDVDIVMCSSDRTCVNGSPVTSPLQLHHGDRILWGNNHFFR